jgi:hypothetical protein
LTFLEWKEKSALRTPVEDFVISHAFAFACFTSGKTFYLRILESDSENKYDEADVKRN